tara:strand:- start:149 stop:598 length:450 start_codon:yes stop_codon:yes gene_type:complete
MTMKSTNLITFSKYLFYLFNGLLLLTFSIFTINHVFDLKQLFSNNLTILILSTATLFKLIYWQFFKSIKTNNIKDVRISFLKLTFLILTFALPIYMILQEPKLVIDQQMSKISFFLILLFLIIGIFIERYLFFLQIKNYKNKQLEQKNI